MATSSSLMDTEFTRVTERFEENLTAQTKILDATIAHGQMITGDNAAEYDRLATLIEADRQRLITLLDEA